MAGKLSLGAEVFLGLDDPGTEKLGPVAIDGHAGRERVLAIDEPLRQAQTVHRTAGGQGVERLGNVRATGSPGSRKFPLRSTFVTRCLSLGSSTITGTVGISGCSFSSRAISLADRLQLGRDRTEVTGQLWACALVRCAASVSRIARIALGMSFPHRGVSRVRETLASHITCAVASLGAAAACSSLLFQLGDLPVDLAKMLVDLGCGRGDHGRLVGLIGVCRLVEDRIELVVFLIRERVVLVAVALGAAHRQAHPDLHRGVDAVLDRGHAELLVVGSAFGVGHRVAMKGRGDLLVEGRAWQQVAGDLLDGELVVGKVAVQGVDDPVAIAPDGAERIGAVAGGIGVTCQVQPHPCPPLAEGRVVQEPVDGSLIGTRGLVG